MKKLIVKIFSSLMLVASVNSFATGFVEGVPVAIQKTDYSGLHLLFVQFDQPIPAVGCTGKTGVVVLDSNESSEAALGFALTAQASGKKFRCYIYDNQCSAITGAATTFPVCAYYPSLVN